MGQGGGGRDALLPGKEHRLAGGFQHPVELVTQAGGQNQAQPEAVQQHQVLQGAAQHRLVVDQLAG